MQLLHEDKPKILFVDDDKSVLKALMRFSRTRSWNCDCALSGADALSMADCTTYDLVVSDFSMPRMSGEQLLKEMKDQHPKTVRVLISGIENEKVLENVACSTEAYGLVSKPWDEQILYDTIFNGLLYRMFKCETSLNEFESESMPGLVKRQESLLKCLAQYQDWLSHQDVH